MYPDTPLEGQARLLERQRGNEFSLYQKVNLQREENQDLVRQNMAHVANEEAMKKHALMQSMKIDELNSIIQRQQREIASLKKDNSELKASLDQEIYGKVEKVSANFERETSFVSDPKFEKVPQEILKLANKFKEEYALRPFPSVFDSNIVKLNEAWNRQTNKLVQKEKGKLLVDIELLRGMVRQAKLNSAKGSKERASSRPKTSSLRY